MEENSRRILSPENESSNAFMILLELIDRTLEANVKDHSGQVSELNLDEISVGLSRERDQEEYEEVARVAISHLLNKLAFVERCLDRTRTANKQLLESRGFFRSKSRNLQKSCESLKAKYDTLEAKYLRIKRGNRIHQSAARKRVRQS